MSADTTPGGERGAASVPVVSVVIETYNEEADPVLGVDDVLVGLEAQTCPVDTFEIIVVVDRRNPELRRRVTERWPRVEIVDTENSTYYSMKTAGAAVARSEIIAFLDSDCVPVPIWVERIVANIAAGAHAVAGKTRYSSEAPFARTFNFFNFGYVQRDANGTASDMLPNNAAFRRDVWAEHGFHPKIRRSGAILLLTKQLQHLGYRLVYDPAVQVTHNAYGIGEEVLMRVKSGYDVVSLRPLDSSGVLGESSLLSWGPVALLAVFARRIVFDLRTLLRHRQDLDIEAIHIPYFVVVSPLIRGLEMAAGLLTYFYPNYLKEKFRW